MSGENTNTVEEQVTELSKLVREQLEEKATKSDLKQHVEKIDGQLETIRKELPDGEAAEQVTALKEQIKEIGDNYVDRDAVMEILKDIRTTEEENEKKKFLIVDNSTPWEVMATKHVGGTELHDYAFGQDVRFAPISRYTKAGIDESESVPGAGTAIGIPINELRAGNPFAGQVQEIAVGNNGTFQLIDMTTMSFTEEATLNTNRTVVGGSAARSITVDNYTLQTHITDAALEDVASYRMAIEEAIMMADANNKGAQIFATLKTSVNSSTAGTITAVDTGVATGLPTATNVHGKMADLVAAVPAAYRVGARFHISRALEAQLRKATANSNSTYLFDPATGLMRYMGYPVTINDHCEDGDAANELSAIFGSFRRGCGIGQRVMLDVRVMEQTVPGAQTFFARSRFAPAVNDARALAGMRSKA